MGNSQQPPSCQTVSFLCRIKCFNGTTTGFLKMHCVGHMRAFPGLVKSQRTSNQVLFVFCRPFLSSSTDAAIHARAQGFWSKHGLDMKFRQMDASIDASLGWNVEELEGRSLYDLVHPEDLTTVTACHKTLIHTEDIQTMYFRVEIKSGQWLWLHTRGKVVFKNSKKYSIVFTHCPVREEDSTYIQQEVVLRQRYALTELMYGKPQPAPPQQTNQQQFYMSKENINDNGVCPSSWHTSADRHSPVFPNSQHLSPTFPKKEKPPHQHFQKGYNQSGYDHYSGVDSHGGYNAGGCDVNNYGYGPSLDNQYNNNGQYAYPPIKQYHLRFNGIGVNAYPACQATTQQASTLVIQGHVTAIESQGAHQLHPSYPTNCPNPSPIHFSGQEYQNAAAAQRLSAYTDPNFPPVGVQHQSPSPSSSSCIYNSPTPSQVPYPPSYCSLNPSGSFSSTQYFPLEAPLQEPVVGSSDNVSDPSLHQTSTWQHVKIESEAGRYDKTVAACCGPYNHELAIKSKQGYEYGNNITKL